MTRGGWWETTVSATAPETACDGALLGSNDASSLASGGDDSLHVQGLHRRHRDDPSSDAVGWDRDAHALISGLTMATTRGHVARAAVDSIAHQICDIVDRIEQIAGPLRTIRADGGATASDLVVQTQANLLNRAVEVSDVAEVSALGAARLAWTVLGQGSQWPTTTPVRVFTSQLDDEARIRQRWQWTTEVHRARFKETAHHDHR